MRVHSLTMYQTSGTGAVASKTAQLYGHCVNEVFDKSYLKKKNGGSYNLDAWDMLDKGANLRAQTLKKGELPLHVAARHGPLGCVRLLVTWKDPIVCAQCNVRNDDGDTPLDLAVRARETAAASVQGVAGKNVCVVCRKSTQNKCSKCLVVRVGSLALFRLVRSRAPPPFWE